MNAIRKIIRMLGKFKGGLGLLFQYLKYGFKAREVHYGSYIGKPLILNGIENLSLGKGSYIQKNGYIEAMPYTGEKECRLIIGSRTRIGFTSHIIATRRVVIGNNVEIASNVYLSDNMHGYEDVDMPIRDQSIVQKNEVIIGDDTWLGENVCVLGAKVGRHCVIGANSVVTKDIPDYCVVVGAPARIIKRYDFETKAWRKTNPKGEFID